MPHGVPNNEFPLDPVQPNHSLDLSKNWCMIDGKALAFGVCAQFAWSMPGLTRIAPKSPKSNEIKLDMLLLKLRIVTIDAMGCQREIAGQVIES